MNEPRRQRISAQLQVISEARNELDLIKDEEQEYYDNMPEGLQGSEKGEKATETVDQLQMAVDDLDGAMASLENIE